MDELALAHYFRCTPYFRAPEGPRDWLAPRVIVGVGRRRPKLNDEASPAIRCSDITPSIDPSAGR